VAVFLFFVQFQRNTAADFGYFAGVQLYAFHGIIIEIIEKAKE
jgi:hypothetical protein